MTDKRKFLVLDYLLECTIEKEVLGLDADINCFRCENEKDLPEEITELIAVEVWHKITLSKYSIERLSSCKAIVRTGVGYDNIDYISAGEFGIPVVNVPDYGTNDIADHTFALILNLIRKVSVYNGALQKDPIKGWDPLIGGKMRRLTGLVIGIVGLGRIGTAVGLRAKGFGMKVYFYDPYLPDGFEKTYHFSRVSSLEELVKVNISDVLTIHAPLTDETKEMIDPNILNNCKPNMILINTARGNIVSLDAVYNALLSNRIDGFAADVLENEPPEPNHPLIKAFNNKEVWTQGRLLFTPHVGFFAEETQRELRYKAAVQMLNAARKIPLSNCINGEYLKTSRVPFKSISNPRCDIGSDKGGRK